MALLAFILECAAVAALVGAATSLLLWPVLVVLRQARGPRHASAPRADLAFMLGTLPALASLLVVAAAASPPVVAALGLAEDHCLHHGHHLHLCFRHSAGLRPVLAVVGAFSLAFFLLRAGGFVWRLVERHSRLSALEALGTRRPGRFPLITVPGAPQLCHAVGGLRGRILLSASLQASLSPEELRAALAHEEAHLRRRDPLAMLLLRAAGLLAAPFLGRSFLAEYQAAAEEACDAEAAEHMGDGGLVASALVKVAALQRQASRPAEVGPAFGALALERRVRLLLEAEGTRGAPGSHSFLLAGAAALGGLLLTLRYTAFLHHLVETVLHHLS